jgi:HTH-type transcriptional regulator/antitoxin HipB
VTGFDLGGLLRRVRRASDLSQRQLAARIGVSKSAVAAAESGERDLAVGILARAAAVAGWRLTLLDGEGQEVVGMADGAVRDRSGRRFPAHLDTWYSDVSWWPSPFRWDRPQPWYTFDRVRAVRDAVRERHGTPEDHRVPQPGDSPDERWAARQRAALERTREERERKRAAGELRDPPEFSCSCLPACDELDDWSGRPVHAPACACGCDVG